MKDLRAIIDVLDASGDLLHVSREVAPQFELGALLKQAEARRKAILFRQVAGSSFPVVGGLLTSPQRFAVALGLDGAEAFDQAAHANLVRNAIENPVGMAELASGSCKDVILTGDAARCSLLPVPTFFAGDSGPFLTAAVGISRNPDNGVVNAGFYRIWVYSDHEIAVSASPSSDLHRFIRAAEGSGQAVPLVLIIGAEPALLMAASAKVPAETSELDVAGALQGEALQVARAEFSDLPVPVNAEFAIELAVRPDQTVENTMGEFGDQYGTQHAFRARVDAITHRDGAVFHAIMAGAGKEHNSLGMIILYELEPELRRDLAVGFPEVENVRVYFEPPRMGMRGEAYIQVRGGRSVSAKGLVEHVYSLVCGRFPLDKVIRRVILLDTDIDLQNRREIDWAVATRAVEAQDYMFFDAPGGVRLGIDARARPDAGMEKLIIPGSEHIRLDDYIDQSAGSSNR
jgi:2,5-furandicarboxylate decarboxylase 1